MTRDDIIRMAREACDTDKVDAWSNGFWTITQEEIERFAALVAAAEREAMQERRAFELAESYRCGWDGGAAAEREACAKVCEDIDTEYDGEDVLATWCAAEIRARGQK
jgi:hypothetical protein